MFTSLFARLSALLSVYFMSPVLSGVSARARRGAGFMEYALLAALAVGIFLILSRVFPGLFEGIIERIRGALGWSGT